MADSNTTQPGPGPADTTSAKDAKYRKRHAEILAAAAAVFAEKGYHGASTTDIAGSLGIRQGSLYYYFKSKQEALSDVCRTGVASMVDALESLLAEETDPRALFRRALLGHLRPIRDNRDNVKVFLKERQHLEGENRRVVGRLSRRYEAQFAQVVERGIAAGLFRGDLATRTVVLGILGQCNSAFDWVERDNPDIEAIAAIFTEMLLNGLTAQHGEAPTP